MLTQEKVQTILNQMYHYTSFDIGGKPFYIPLKRLFIEDAKIIEYPEKDVDRFVIRNIDDHLQYLKEELLRYPMLRSMTVVELTNRITICRPFVFVESQYERRLNYDGSILSCIGIKCMQMALYDDELKIMSIGYREL